MKLCLGGFETDINDIDEHEIHRKDAVQVTACTNASATHERATDANSKRRSPSDGSRQVNYG